MDNVNKQEAPLLKVDPKPKKKNPSGKIRIIAFSVIVLYMLITTVSCVVATWEFIKPENLF